MIPQGPTAGEHSSWVCQLSPGRWGWEGEKSECQLNCEASVREAERGLSRVKRGFPDSSVAGTPRSHYRGPGFDPWSGNWIPQGTIMSSYGSTQDPVYLS